MKELKLPDLGEGLSEAEIVNWMVKAGDSVEADQPLVSVETAKAVVEVPSPVTGIITKLHFDEGEIVEVGQILASFGDGLEADAAEPAPAVEAEDSAEERQDKGTVAGALKETDEVVKEDEDSVTGAREAMYKAAPAVRALARKLDVDLKIVTPTGPNNIITKNDVERVHKILQEIEPMEPLRGVRRAMANTMATAHAEVVHASLMDEVDIHAWTGKQDITIRIMRAIAKASEIEPTLNAWYFPKEGGWRLIKKVHLGIAMDTEDGLFVPVINDIGNRASDDLRKDLNRLKEAVRNREVPPEELRGHTFTLSNFGMFAGKHGLPIVVPPTVAILACGRIYERVVLEDGQCVNHKFMPLSLGFDHRCITGGEGTRWLKGFMDDMALTD